LGRRLSVPPSTASTMPAATATAKNPRSHFFHPPEVLLSPAMVTAHRRARLRPLEQRPADQSPAHQLHSKGLVFTSPGARPKANPRFRRRSGARYRVRCTQNAGNARWTSQPGLQFHKSRPVGGLRGTHPRWGLLGPRLSTGNGHTSWTDVMCPGYELISSKRVFTRSAQEEMKQTE
jgi:hypothetical protein